MLWKVNGDSMKKTLIVGMLCLTGTLPGALVHAQLKSQIPETPTLEQVIRVPGVSSLNNLSWFDPNRFSIHQSYSLSFISGSGQSQSLGLYQNSMSYVFSDKLLLNTRFGFVHNPFNVGNAINRSNMLDNLLYGADLTYRPRENLIMNFSFDKVPVTYRYRYYPYNSLYSPY